MSRRIFIFIILTAFASNLCFGQDETLPAPYKPDEFPQWTLDLRRAEVVTVGSFPLSFMVTALVYDLSLLAVDNKNYNDDPDLYPRAQFGSHRSQDDIARLLLISGGVSIAIGLTDFIINQVKRNRSEREEQERNEQRRDSSDSSGISETENR